MTAGFTSCHDGGVGGGYQLVDGHGDMVEVCSVLRFRSQASISVVISLS